MPPYLRGSPTRKRIETLDLPRSPTKPIVPSKIEMLLMVTHSALTPGEILAMPLTDQRMTLKFSQQQSERVLMRTTPRKSALGAKNPTILDMHANIVQWRATRAERLAISEEGLQQEVKKIIEDLIRIKAVAEQSDTTKHALSADIIYLVFENLLFDDVDRDVCTAACLGLTCRLFQTIFKALHSGPVPLTSMTYIPRSIRNSITTARTPAQTSLFTLLKIWMPRTYRPINHRRFLLYVNRDRYGDGNGEIVAPGSHEAARIKALTIWSESRSVSGDPVWRLKNPFGQELGSWFTQAASDVMLDSVKSCKNGSLAGSKVKQDFSDWVALLRQ